MARPVKATVDYFPHYTDHGKTIFILESKYGNDGYAAWFKILAYLGKQKGLLIDCNNPATWEYLHAYTRVKEPVLKQIINTLACLEAIDPDLWGFRIIFSQNFVSNVADAFKRRRELLPNRETVIAYINDNYPELLQSETPLNGLNADINWERKGKERKGKETISSSDISTTSVIETATTDDPLSTDDEVILVDRVEPMPVSKAKSLYVRYFGKLPVNSGIGSILLDICRKYPPERIEEAFQAAGAAQAQHLSYVVKCLENPHRSAAADVFGGDT